MATWVVLGVLVVLVPGLGFQARRWLADRAAARAASRAAIHKVFLRAAAENIRETATESLALRMLALENREADDIRDELRDIIVEYEATATPGSLLVLSSLKEWYYVRQCGGSLQDFVTPRPAEPPTRSEVS